jgi:hypothetical protein
VFTCLHSSVQPKGVGTLTSWLRHGKDKGINTHLPLLSVALHQASYTMSLNDMSLSAQGTDTYPGVANPTASSTNSDPMASNFVTDPTSEDRGAGAGPDFAGDKQAQRSFQQTAGVVEGRPGIIESSNIDPLNENSNKGIYAVANAVCTCIHYTP